MGINFGGHIFNDGRKIDVGSPEFNELMPITTDVIKRIQANDDISEVASVLAMAVLKLEVELNNLRDEVQGKGNA